MATRTPHVLFERIHPKARTPIRATSGSVGYDLFAVMNQTIRCNEIKSIRTGLKVRFPPGVYGQIADRSSMVINNRILVRAGIIDTDFEDEIKVIMASVNKQPYQIHAGDRIAQIVPKVSLTTDWMEVPSFLNGDKAGRKKVQFSDEDPEIIATEEKEELGEKGEKEKNSKEENQEKQPDPKNFTGMIEIVNCPDNLEVDETFEPIIKCSGFPDDIARALEATLSTPLEAEIGERNIRKGGFGSTGK